MNLKYTVFGVSIIWGKCEIDFFNILRINLNCWHFFGLWQWLVFAVATFRKQNNQKPNTKGLPIGRIFHVIFVQPQSVRQGNVEIVLEKQRSIFELNSSYVKIIIHRQNFTLENFKEKIQIECEKIPLGRFFCAPLLSKLANVIANGIRQDADTRRICATIGVCSKQHLYEIEQREQNQRDNVDETDSTSVQSQPIEPIPQQQTGSTAANVNHYFVCFNLPFSLFFILSITYIIN